MSKIDEFLQHYASPYYDPVKAHEYYVKRRKLKGRTSRGMSEKQKEAWYYTKDQITNEKKNAGEQLRDRISQERQRLYDKLKAVSRYLPKEEKDRIRSELKASIAKVREAYKVARDQLDAEYETKYQKEYDNIRTKIPGKKNKRRITQNG